MALSAEFRSLCGVAAGSSVSMSGEGRQAWIWFRPICWRPDLGLWGWVLLGVAGTSLLSSWGPSRGSWNFLPFFLEGGVSLGLCSSGLEGPFAVPSSAMALGLVVTCTSGVAGEAVCWVGRALWGSIDLLVLRCSAGGLEERGTRLGMGNSSLHQLEEFLPFSPLTHQGGVCCVLQLLGGIYDVLGVFAG